MILRSADLTLFHEQWSASVGRIDPSPGSWPSMPLGDPQITRCVLRPQPDSTSAARDFARKALAGWGVGDLADDAAAVVSELVGNVLRRGRPATADPGQYGRIQLILLHSLLHSGHRLTAIVTDSGPDAPVPSPPDGLADDGRKLHLVRPLTTTWGWARLATGGKAVWVVINDLRRYSEPSLAIEEPIPHKATADL